MRDDDDHIPMRHIPMRLLTARLSHVDRTRSPAIWVVAAMCLLSVTLVVVAQQPKPADPAPPNSAPSEPSSLDAIAVEQGKIADKYARLEQLLIRMSELEATSNPQRAALLKRAAQQSSDKLTRQQLNTLVKLLVPPAQLKRAVDDQQQIVGDLKALLELLQSENRSDRLKSERTRIRDYIKEVDRLIRLQQGVQGRTEGGDDANKLAKDQQNVADRTGKLAQQVKESEEGAAPDQKSAEDAKENEPGKEGSKSADKKSGDGKSSSPGSSPKNSPKEKTTDDKSKNQKPSDQKPGDQKSGDQKPSDQKPGDSKSGDQKPSDQKPSDQKGGEPKAGGPPKSGESPKDSGKPSKGTPQESPDEPSPSAPSEPQSEEPSADQTKENPVRKRLEAAEERMRAAEKKLSEAKQKEATADQEQAREELEKAKAELEQILKQMREEEMERTLAMLEGRFRRMLETQLKIYESTKRLDRIAAPQRTRDVDIQSNKLGFEQGKLSVEADKALLLLREEGSSVAFPETVEMMRDDMQQVADRLAATHIDRVTQGIEEEIIQTLEELIASMQKAQQDLKDKKSPPPMPQQPMDPSDRPLVDQLAEIKMIRALQLRVNTRTQRYARLLTDADDPVGRANDADLRQSLSKLAEMQQRIHEITRNLVLGKNE